MKNLTITTLSALLAVMTLVSPVQAEMVTRDEALTVAKNWVTLIIQKEGDWGGSEWAEVQGIQEFKRGERVIGYFCHVRPKGFIVVSLRKELAPVKAYSARSDVDPASEEGMADLIKGGMQGILDAIEKQVGPIKSARTQDVQKLFETDYQPDWEKLQLDVQTFKTGLASGAITMNYQEGDWLLTSAWHQTWPYNSKCEHKDCTDTRLNGYAWAGCGPIAAAQIMRYWAWPPGRDWAKMPDSLDGSSDDQINAVASLIADIGEEAGTDYECDVSNTCMGGCPGKDIRDTFADHFGYLHKADFEWWCDLLGQCKSDTEWFEIIKNNININRPLVYGIGLTITALGDTGGGEPHHIMVCDGWQVVGSSRQMHINYGHGDTSKNTFYDLNHFSGRQAVIRRIRPMVSEGSWAGGGKPQDTLLFPYRYFDQDASGHNAVYEAGHKLQFLPGITVTCTSTTGQYVRFVGTSSDPTELFSIRGSATGGIVAGIKIYNGGIRLYQNGSLRFHE